MNIKDLLSSVRATISSSSGKKEQDSSEATVSDGVYNSLAPEGRVSASQHVSSTPNDLSAEDTEDPSIAEPDPDIPGATKVPELSPETSGVGAPSTANDAVRTSRTVDSSRLDGAGPAKNTDQSVEGLDPADPDPADHDSKAARQGSGAAEAMAQIDPHAVTPPRSMFSGTVPAFRIGLVGTLGVGIGVLIWGAVDTLSLILTYVGLALFIALGLNPLVHWLESKKFPRPAAVATVFGILLLIFVGILVAIIPILINQTQRLVSDFPSFIQDFLKQEWVINLQQALQGSVDFHSIAGQVTSFISDPNNLMNVGGGIFAVGAGIATGVTGGIIVLVLTLYFLASLEGIKKAGYTLVPASKRRGFISVTEEITGAVGRYVIGQVSLAMINGVLSFILLNIIGAPVPFLLACIAFVCSLVPLVGTLTGSIVISLVCYLASPLTGLVAIIYYLVYMQVEAYVISPRIMKKAVAVPGSVVVIAAAAGGTLGGVLGALVAIPVAASFIIIIEKVIIPRQAKV